MESIDHLGSEQRRCSFYLQEKLRKVTECSLVAITGEVNTDLYKMLYYESQIMSKDNAGDEQETLLIKEINEQNHVIQKWIDTRGQKNLKTFG